MGVISKAFFSFVSTGIRERGKGDIRRRERICAVIAGRMGGELCWFIYTPAFTVSYDIIVRNLQLRQNKRPERPSHVNKELQVAYGVLLRL